MEFIRGDPLDLYAAWRCLDTQQRLELTSRICEAVHHAHQRGIVHRDLKPGNILVNETGHPKILDLAWRGLGTVMPGRRARRLPDSSMARRPR